MQTFRARYPGACVQCGREWQTGELIGRGAAAPVCFLCTLPPGISPEQAGDSGRLWPTLGESVVVVLETTGRDPAKHRIRRICTLQLDGEELGQLEVHSFVEGSAEESAEELIGLLTGRVVLGYDLPKVLSFLRAETQRRGGTLPQLPAVCLLQTARRTHPELPTHRLDSLTEALGLREEDEKEDPSIEGRALLLGRLTQHLLREAARTGRSHKIALTREERINLLEEQPTTPPPRREESRREVPWRVRDLPAGWEAETTVLGGRRPGEEETRPQVQILKHLPERSTDPERQWYTAVGKKLLTRSAAIEVSGEVAAVLEQLPEKEVEEYTGKVRGLHPVYEAPLWEEVARTHPELLPHLHPQAPLEDLLPEEVDGERYVDFLLYVPGSGPVVLELDGKQHETQREADRERDRLLSRTGRVVRLPGREAATSTELAEILAAAAAALGEQRSRPEHTHPRLVHALLEGIHAEVLTGPVWRLSIEDESGAAEALLPHALSWLERLERIGQTRLLPERVECNGHTLVREEAWRRSSAATTGGADLHIHLQEHTPLAATLPEGENVLVYRGTSLPVQLSTRIERGPRRRIEKSTEGSSALRELLEETTGHREFRPGQEEALWRSLAGEDLSVLLPTGGGKSLVYLLAGLLQPGVQVLVYPIVSLIHDQERRLRGHRVVALSGTHQRTREERDEALRRIEDGTFTHLLLTPERLQTREVREALRAASRRAGVALSVVDEAHCVSEWGHDFRTSYLKVGRTLREVCRSQSEAAPLLALTGTASPVVLRDVHRELAIPGDGSVQPAEQRRTNLTHRMRRGSWRHALRQTLLADVPAHHDVADLREVPGGGIVFVPWANGEMGVLAVEQEIQKLLYREGVKLKTAVYSGAAPRGEDPGTWEEKKRQVAEAFISGQIQVLVATKAFGMGIDKPDVSWTLHLGYPSSIEAYAQEAGRAGRAGQEALCTLVGNVTDPERARKVLDPRLTWDEFLVAARTYQERTRWDGDDLAKQLYFLTGSLPGTREEYEHAAEMLSRIEKHPPGGEVSLPRTGSQQEERALYRLMLLGIVEDATIAYGSARNDLVLGERTGESVDTHLLVQLTRMEPDRDHQEALEGAPEALPERRRHHLRKLVEKVYEHVAPGRRNALAGIWDLSNAGGPGAVRNRLEGYLTSGPVRDLLERTLTGQLHLEAALPELLRQMDDEEWIGAATRVLEDTPHDPLAHILRGAATLRSSGDEDAALADLASGYRSIQAGARILAWSLKAVRAHTPERAVVCWKAWEAAGRREDLHNLVQGTLREGHELEVAWLKEKGKSRPSGKRT